MGIVRLGADTIWIAAFPFLLSAVLRDVLPSMAITSADTPVMLVTHSTNGHES
jgi:hypothetical protein